MGPDLRLAVAMERIESAAVIGAGVMGAGIAAQFADAGLAVALLDLDPARAADGVARQIRAGGFNDPAGAERIRIGSSISDLPLVGDADWIVEAAAENLEVKRRIFAALNAVRKPGSIVSSNTSTIPLAALVEELAPGTAPDFMITHFFNPPRHMRLMELVTGPATRPDAVTVIADFAEQRLGKTVVRCADTPGFVANRLGNFWMATALDEAIRQGLDVEETDAVIGPPFGTPAGLFALLDLVGIDLLPSGWGSLKAALPADDLLQAYPAAPPLIARMIADGRLGRKSGAGFTRRLPDGSFETLDLTTLAYRPARPAGSDAVERAGGDLRALMGDESPAGRFAGRAMGRTFAYAAALVPAVAATPELVDLAMRDGYGWKQGPFELIERVGAGWLLARLTAEGVAAPAWLRERAATNAEIKDFTASGETVRGDGVG